MLVIKLCIIITASATIQLKKLWNDFHITIVLRERKDNDHYCSMFSYRDLRQWKSTTETAIAIYNKLQISCNGSKISIGLIIQYTVGVTKKTFHKRSVQRTVQRTGCLGKKGNEQTQNGDAHSVAFHFLPARLMSIVAVSGLVFLVRKLRNHKKQY